MFAGSGCMKGCGKGGGKRRGKTNNRGGPPQCPCVILLKTNIIEKNRFNKIYKDLTGKPKQLQARPTTTCYRSIMFGLKRTLPNITNIKRTLPNIVR